MEQNMVQGDSNLVQPPKKKFNPCALLGVVGIVLILGMAVAISTCANPYHNLKASVQYDGAQFVFRNDDDFDWNGVQFLLNTDYKFNTPTIAAHSEFAAENSQFAKDDGTKFTGQPTDFIVTARIPNDQWSSWFYKFN